MKKSKVIVLLLILLNLTGCYDMQPIENLLVIVGFGFDLDKADSQGRQKLKNTVEVITFKGNKDMGSTTYTGTDISSYAAQNERQTMMSKKYILGLEKLYLISEQRARMGIRDIININLRDARRNEVAHIGICKDAPEEILRMENKQEFNNSLKISDEIGFSYMGNFFSKKFSISDVMFMYYQEGRCIVLPYLEKISDQEVKITGLAIFKGDKMIRKADMKEAFLIGMLRDKGTQGYINLGGKTPEDYIDMYSTGKRKINVSMAGDNLKYDVSYILTGSLLSDSIDQNQQLDDEGIKNIETKLSEKYEKLLQQEVEKIKEVDGFDVLGFGRYAVAKYGRGKGYESDEMFMNSEINVHVTVKTISAGRTTK